MDGFYKFAGDHPILTVILALIIVSGIVTIVRGRSST